jgi:anaphase-promoting complex subunit 1
MQSGNKEIAAHLAAPANSYLLDTVRPELLLVQTISRNLILWNGIRPTRDWVVSYVPKFMINAVVAGEKEKCRIPRNEHMLHCYFALLVGQSFSIGLRFAGSCNSAAFETLSNIVDILSKAATPSGNIYLTKSSKTLLPKGLHVPLLEVVSALH